MRIAPRTVAMGAVPVAALAVDPGGLAPFGPAKWLALPTCLLGAAALVAWGKGIGVVRPTVMAWAGFLLVAAAAAATGVDRLYAWTGTPERHLGVITWALCATAFLAGTGAAGRDRRAVVAGAVLAAGGLGAWAVAETLGWEPFRLAGTGDRPLGPFGSSAYLGAAASLLGPAALGVALDGRFGWTVRRLAALAAGAAGVALVVSGARAAWLGAAAAGVVVMVGRRPVNRRALLPIAAALAAAMALAFASGVAGRAGDVVSDRDGGARGRLDEWRVAWRVIAAHPVLGVGPEGYRIAFGRAVDDRYEQAHGRDPLPDRAHDVLLDVAATTGLVGLAAYGALLLVAGRYVVRALRRAPPWTAGVAAGLVAYAAQSLFLFPIGELEPVAWLLAGAVVGEVAVAGEWRSVRLPRAVPAAAAALAVLAFAAGALDVAADRRADAALRGRGDPTGAAALRPDALRYRLAAARVLADEGSYGAAVGQLDRALDVSPLDPVVRRERARLMLERARRGGDPAQLHAALAVLRQLSADDPRNAVVLLRLGVAEALSGNDPAAERAWKSAERLAPRSAAASTDLALAYARLGRIADARAAARRALAREPSNERARQVLRQLDGT
jgi:O-antigen ligase